MTKRMQIGAFGRLVGVSVKTLRFYADEGLLLPAETDPSSGYRYYTPVQVADATKILNLRAVGVSLAEIRALVSGTHATRSAVESALIAQRRDLERQRALIDSQIGAIDTLLAAIGHLGDDALAEVRVTIQEPEFAYVLRADLETARPDVTALFERAERSVSEVEGRAVRPPFLLSHTGEDGAPVTIDVCIPVTDQVADAPNVELVGKTTIAVSLTHRGGYGRNAEQERCLREGLDRLGLDINGPRRTIYHRFGADQAGYALPSHMLAKSSSGYVTEISFPVTQKG